MSWKVRRSSCDSSAKEGLRGTDVLARRKSRNEMSCRAQRCQRDKEIIVLEQ